MPREQIPQRIVRVTCPQCRKMFTFDGNRLRAEDILVKPRQHPVLAVSPPAEPEPETPRRTALSGIGELFGKSWRVFVSRILILVGINLLAFLPAGLGYLALGSLADRMAALARGSLLMKVATISVMTAYSLVVIAWISAALTYAIVEEDLGVRQALGYGLQRIWSFLWVSLLTGFIMTGGYLLFFVPGVLFTLWFLFAPFVLAREDTRGMDALLKSKACVAGFGWAVLGRLLLAAGLVAIISVPLSFLPIFGGLLSLLPGFFLMIYYAEIHKELSEIKGDLSFDCSRGVKTRWLLAGGSGFVTALGLALALGGLG
jgi:hypothetical protein